MRAAQFAWLVLQAWATWLTGGIVALILVLIDKLTNWRLPKWVYLVVASATLLVSVFQVWQGENDRAIKAEARLSKLLSAPDPRRAEYRNRVLLLETETRRAIDTARTEWEFQKDQRRRIIADPTQAVNRQRWVDELAAIEKSGVVVLFGPIYDKGRILLDEIKIYTGADTSKAEKSMNAARALYRPRTTPDEARRFADDLHALAEQLRSNGD